MRQVGLRDPAETGGGGGGVSALVRFVRVTDKAIPAIE